MMRCLSVHVLFGLFGILRYLYILRTLLTSIFQIHSIHLNIFKTQNPVTEQLIRRRKTMLVLMGHNNINQWKAFTLQSEYLKRLVNCIFLVLYKMQQKATKLVPVGLVFISLHTWEARHQSMETSYRHNPLP